MDVGGIGLTVESGFVGRIESILFHHHSHFKQVVIALSPVENNTDITWNLIYPDFYTIYALSEAPIVDVSKYMQSWRKAFMTVKTRHVFQKNDPNLGTSILACTNWKYSEVVVNKSLCNKMLTAKISKLY